MLYSTNIINKCLKSEKPTRELFLLMKSSLIMSIIIENFIITRKINLSSLQGHQHKNFDLLIHYIDPQ